MPKRLLVIAYYFPPSGGAGVQRVLKFVKYLPDFGWEPTVLTVREGAFPQHDSTLADDLPDSLAVHRTEALDPFALYGRLTGKALEKAIAAGSLGKDRNWKEKLARWVRANVFIPDARVGWVPYAIREGKRLLASQQYDAVLTSGPPQSVHLIGRALHRETGVPWLADFRDPWTESNYYHEFPRTPLAAWLDRRMEQSVLREATAVTTVSPAWVEGLKRVSGQDGSKFHLVQNGYDAEDFAEPSPPVAQTSFYLAHVGNLYASRNPETLWSALGELKQSGKEVKVRLIGGHDPVVAETAASFGVAEALEAYPYLPHGAAVVEMRKAPLLLLVVEPFKASGGMLTGKLYEYLASGRPVLGLGPVEGDAARLLLETGAGTFFAHGDVEGVATFLERHHAAWVSGRPAMGADTASIHELSRRSQTRYLAHILSGITA